MAVVPIPPREAARLDALHRSHILDTPSEQAFDELARLAAYVCRTPMAVISLVDSTRQWCKSAVGLPHTESPRSQAFCAHTILGTGFFIVEEADADERFAGHPWVVESPFIRFYAGVPLITSDGHAIGSLAVMDVVPRVLTTEQREAMQTLAKQVMAQFELRAARASQNAQPFDAPLSAASSEGNAVCHREQEERSKQERLLTLMLNTGPGCIKRVAADGTLLHMNPAGLKLIEASCEQEAIGRSVFDLVCPAHRAAFMRMHQDVLGGAARTLQFEIQGLQGARRWLETHAVPFQNPVTGGTEHLAITYDITERKRADEALRLSQERLCQALQASNTGLWDWNTETDAVSFSKEWKAQLGYGEGELPDSFKTWVSQLHPDDCDRAVAYAQAYRDNPVGVFRQDFRLRHKDGSYRWIDSQASFVTEPDGRRIRMLGAHTDITDRKRMELALAESGERFSYVAEATNDGIWDWDISTGLVYFSPQWLRLLGYLPQEVSPLFEFFMTILHPDDAVRLTQVMQAHMDGHLPVMELELRLRHKSGAYRWFLDRGKVVTRGQDGKPLRMVGTITDITERKQADQALRLTRFSIERAVDAVFWVDASARILDVNEAACTMLGYTREELLSKTVHDIDPSFPAEAWPAHWEDLKARKSFSFETDHRKKDGTVIQTETTVNFLIHEGREFNCAFMRDITERKRAKSRLQATQYAVDHATDCIFVIGNDGRFLDVNESACSRLGYTKEELLSKSVMDIDPDWSWGDWKSFWEAFKRTKLLRLETRHRAKSGEIYPVEIVANYILHEGRELDYAFVRDISVRKKAEAFAEGQRTVLDLIAKNAPLPDILSRLCTEAEKQSDGMLCSVLLLEGTTLRHAAAPSLPDEYTRAIDGSTIGPTAGSCGTAAYKNESVVVADIATDPLWADYKEIALGHGLRACWSTPIRDAGGMVLGTFAVYHRTAVAPDPAQYELINMSVYLGGIAIERRRAEEALRFSEARFRLVAEATQDILWDWNVGTGEHWWSPNARERFGYDEHHEASHQAWVTRLHSDDRTRVLELVERALASETRMFTAEYRFRLADGSYGYFYDRGQILRDETGRAVRMIGAMIDVTFSKRAYASLEDAYQRLQRLSRELQMVESNERRRLSRELHDEVGQLLTALKFDLEATRQALTDESAATAVRAHQRTVRALETTDELFARLRRVVRALRPPVLEELGLKEAIEIMVTDIQSRTDMVCSVAVEQEEGLPPADPTIVAALYRIAQELVTNVVRHAQAMTLSVALTADARHWTLIVQDDGAGFNPTIESISGMGIRGICERAEILGGRVDFSSSPGAGTTVTVWIPVPASGTAAENA